MVSWLDRLQRRSRTAGFAIAVVYKYVDDQGGYLAALITYYRFVSLFPLLLLLTTVLGVVLAGHPDLRDRSPRRPGIIAFGHRRRGHCAIGFGRADRDRIVNRQNGIRAAVR